MNERIKELEKQAFDEIWDSDDSLIGPLTHLRPDGFEKKFAELIVRECANHCDLLLDHKMSSEWARGTHDCSKAIKKHFGVEE